MKVFTCRKCGFSLVLSRVVRFNKNGTITLFLARDYRVSLIEADFFDEVFERIEQELGLPIAVLEVGAGEVSVQDAGSLNGVYVNGVSVDRAALHTGDQVQIGRFQMVFMSGGPE